MLGDPTQQLDTSQLVDPSLTGGQFLNASYATPQQRQMLYAYANQLMQPTPIKSGWQGLASIAQALVGGYMGHQADVQEQAARANAQTEATPTGGQASAAPSSMAMPSVSSGSPVPGGVLMPPPPSPGLARADKTPDPADYPTTQAGQTAFLRDYAPFAGGRGLDPNFALGVGGAEGLNAISPQNPNGASSIDVDPRTGKPFSFGALQLNVRDGLGVDARAAGIDPADPAQANKANKFALDYMATKGLAPWRGDKAVEAYRATLAHNLGAAGGASPPVQVASNGPMAPPPGYAPTTSPTSAAPAVAAIGTPPATTQSPAIAALAAALRGQPQSAPPPDPRLALAAGLTGQMPPRPPINPSQLSTVDRLSPAAGIPMGARAPTGPIAGTPMASLPANVPLPPVRPPGLGVPPPAQGAPPAQVASVAPGPGAMPMAAPSTPPAAVASAIPSPSAAPMAPTRIAQNAPAYSPQQLGAMIADPNLPPEIRAHALALTQPTAATDALGNVSPVYQGQSVGAPVFHGGAIGTSPAPGVTNVIGGSLANPTSTLAIPQVAGAQPLGRGGIGPAAGPSATGGAGDFLRTGPIADINAAAQERDAQAGALHDQAAANSARFRQTIDTQNQVLQDRGPLLQLKQIMDANGGKLPTGEGSENLLKGLSFGNMVSSALGHPLQGADSTLNDLELFRKYGNMIASNLTGHNTDMGLMSAESRSPGVGLSQATNAHLVDNLLRMNDLAANRAKFEHDYYLQNPGPHAYDNFNQAWTDHIGGGGRPEDEANAIPLSGEKYGRTVQIRNPQTGQMEPRVVVPSTSKKGYSSYAPGTIPEVATP